MCGLDGASGDASIRQGATAIVPRLAMVAGAAQTGDESFAGPMTIGGDLDLSSGLASGVALADIVGAESDRDVELNDLDNVFNGSVALRRIAGDDSLVMGRCCVLNHRNPRAIAVVESAFFKFVHLIVKYRQAHVRHMWA